ncbi:aminotransferase class IV [Ekhidna sp.]|uniref:aminotransferase class IV n=1 Tax=Ekhidna sp. TaxID=2608089 RepID=UPI003BACE19C
MAYCYFKGSIMDEAEASLSIHTLGVLRGFGAFDFFRMRNKKFYFLEDHLDRFEQSQKFMGLSEIISKDEIREALDMLRDWNKLNDSGFKIVLLGDGNESELELNPLLFITQSDLSNHRPAPYASVILHDYLREYPHIKTTNYLTSNLLHKKRIAAGAIDVIYHHDDLISEASRSNVFVITDGLLSTPSSNILPGVTRKNVLNLCDGVIDVSVKDISVSEFVNADEVFICSTLKEICPIVEVEGKPIGNGTVGPLTKQVSHMFQQLVRD